MILNQLRLVRKTKETTALVYLWTDRSTLMNEHGGACSICVWVCVCIHKHIYYPCWPRCVIAAWMSKWSLNRARTRKALFDQDKPFVFVCLAHVRRDAVAVCVCTVCCVIAVSLKCDTLISSSWSSGVNDTLRQHVTATRDPSSLH